MTKSEILNHLYGRFPKSEYALVDEVRDAAGFYANRSIDFMAFGLWPSRGHDVHAMEVKSSRADWLKELKNPKKQESIYQYSDYMWLVTTNTDIVKDISEIPSTWGWIELKNGKCYYKKQAPKNLNKKTWGISFFAAFVKRMTTRMVHEDSLDDIVKTKSENQNRNLLSKLEIAENKAKEYKSALERFEQLSGIKILRGYFSTIDDEKLERIASALKIVIKNESSTDWHYTKLERMKQELEQTAIQINEILASHKPTIDIEVTEPVMKNYQRTGETQIKKIKKRIVHE